MAHSRGSQDQSHPILAMLGGITGVTPETSEDFINFIQGGTIDRGYRDWRIDKHTDDRIGLTVKTDDGKYQHLDLTRYTEDEKKFAYKQALKRNLDGFTDVKTYDSLAELNQDQPIPPTPIHKLAKQLVEELLRDPSYRKIPIIPMMLYSYNALWAPYIQHELKIRGKSASFILLDQPTQSLLQAQSPINIVNKTYDIFRRVALSQKVSVIPQREKLDQTSLDKLIAIANSKRPVDEMIDNVFDLVLPDFDNTINKLAEKSWGIASNGSRVLLLTLANTKSIYQPILKEKMAKLEDALVVATQDTKNSTTKSNNDLGWVKHISDNAKRNGTARNLYLPQNETNSIHHFSLMTVSFFNRATGIIERHMHVNNIGNHICKQFKTALDCMSPLLKPEVSPESGPAQFALAAQKQVRVQAKRKHTSESDTDEEYVNTVHDGSTTPDHTNDRPNKRARTYPALFKGRPGSGSDSDASGSSKPLATRHSDRVLERRLESTIDEITRTLIASAEDFEAVKFACKQALLRAGFLAHSPLTSPEFGTPYLETQRKIKAVMQ